MNLPIIPEDPNQLGMEQGKRSIDALRDAIYKAYDGVYDYDLVLKQYDVSDSEREQMERDVVWNMRMQGLSLNMKRQAISTIVSISRGEEVNGVRPRSSDMLKASQMLLEVYYPEKWDKTSEDSNAKVKEYESTEVHLPKDGR